MTQTVFVTGGKGGAGVTTFCARLGKSLAQCGERTLIVDGDRECASALGILGLQGLSVYTLADAEKGACRVKQAILQHPQYPNLFILPTLGCNDLSTAEAAVKSCGGLFDKIICDNVAMGACGRAVLVSEPYYSCLTATCKKAAYLKDNGFKEAALVINKVNGGLIFSGEILTPQEISTLVRLPLAGVIPEDLQLPLGRIKTATKKAFSMTCESLFSGGGKIFGTTRAYLGVKGALKRKFREFV